MYARARFLALAIALAFTFALAMLVGCKKSTSSSSAQTFTTLGPSTAAVRDAFNRDVGSVRVLMLVSPS